MSKYEPLAKYLLSRVDPLWVASFDELEKVLGFALPNSARRYPAWWANESGGGHVQAASWREAGWATRKVSLREERVEFERRADPGGPEPTPLAARMPSFPASEDVIGLASRYTGIQDHDALMAAALGALVEREASRWLAQRGGTMPEFTAPERERPAA